ncbi:NAD(P)H-binding protein [Pseudomonas monteilii]|uniref:NAD(P)H-binding protein n=1 Tax=Pseudomonas monteilii TaxID=76759 RepID=UPI00383B6F56
MYVVTGVTGQVGSIVAQALLKAGKPVRAVIRGAAKRAAFEQQGCEVVIADMRNVAALTHAFAGAEAVFVLLPPSFDPDPGFSASTSIIHNLRVALEAAAPRRVVCLSTVGAQATRQNLLSQLGKMESLLGQLPMPVAFLRAAWFMENSAWDVITARDENVLHSFLQPIDKAMPMVATIDVGHTAAQMLQASWQGVRFVELEGPRHVSPLELAGILGRLLKCDVEARAVPRDTWEEVFLAQGMNNPLPRMQMLDGFNEGWITFAGSPVQGPTGVEEVLAGLVKRLA